MTAGDGGAPTGTTAEPGVRGPGSSDGGAPRPSADAGAADAGGAALKPGDPGWKKAYLIARAGDAYHHGRLDEAATLFRSVLKIDQGDEVSLRHLAAIALKRNDLPQATRYLDQGATAHPTSFPLQHELGAVLLRQGKPQQAAPHFLAAMEADPKSVDAAVNYGDCLKLLGNLARAVETYREALKRDPSSAWASRQLGYALFDTQSYGEAIRLLLDASKTFPKEAPLWLVLGHAALKDNQRALAQRAYEQAVATAPNEPRHHLFLGLAHEKQENWPKAIAAYQRSVELAPKDALPKVHLGNAYRAQGDVPKARAQYHAALKLAPKHAWALVQLGFLELEAGRDDEAEKMLKRAAQAAPDNPDVGEALGDLAQKRKDLKRAEAEYRRVLVRNRRHLGSRVKLGDVLRLTGRLGDALDAYRLATEQHPSSLWAHVAYGDGRKANGQLPEALEQYRAALTLDPTSAWALRQLGLVLYDLKDDDAARSTLEALPDAVRGESDVQLTLGHLARRRGELPKAKQHYEAAILASPKQPGPFVALADLQRELGELGKALLNARQATYLAQDAIPDAWVLRGDMATLVLEGEDRPNEDVEKEAITSYERAIRLLPKDPRPKRQLGFFFFKRRQDARAFELITAVVKDYPTDVELPLTLGHLAARQKKPTDALGHYSHAKTLAPADVRPLGFIGATLRELNQLKASKDTLETAAAQHPESGWIQLELGYTLFALRDTKRALVAAEASVKLDDDNPEAWLFLGRMRQRSALVSPAVEAYQRAIKLDAKHALAHRALAGALLDRAEPGDYAKGLKAVEPFLEPLKAEALTFLVHGHLLARLSLAPGEDLERGQAPKVKPKGQQEQEKKRSVASFQQALELGGDDEPTRLSVGQGFVDLFETELAKQTLTPLVEKDLKLCPKDEFSLEWDLKQATKTELVAESPEEAARLERRALLSRAHLLLGELAERELKSSQARFEYACAIALAPDTAEAHLKLGLAYENKGIIRLAEEHAVAASLLNPNLKPARDAVERLRREAGFPVGPLRVAVETSFTSDPLPLEIAANVVRVTGVDASERERLLTVPRTLRFGAAAAFRPKDRTDLPRFELQYDFLVGFGTFLTDRLQFENTLNHAGTLRATGRVVWEALKKAEVNWRAGYRFMGGAATSREEYRHTATVGARLIQLQWGTFDAQLDYEHGDFVPRNGAELVERYSNALSWELRYFPSLKWRRAEGFVSYRGRAVFLGSGRSWGSHRFDVDGLWRGDVWLAGAELNGGIAADRFPSGGPNVAAGSLGFMFKGGAGLSGYTFALAKTGFTFVPGNGVFDAYRVGAEAQHRFFFRKGELSLAISAGYEFRWLYNARHVDHLFMAFLTFGR